MRISDWSSDVCSSDLLNARPRKYDDAFGHVVEHGIVALERCGLFVAVPVRFVGLLGHPPVTRPGGGDPLRTRWRGTMKQAHFRQVLANLVETRIDWLLVVQVRAPREGAVYPFGLLYKPIHITSNQGGAGT